MKLSRGQLKKLGFEGSGLELVEALLPQLPPEWSKSTARIQLQAVLGDPASYRRDELFAELAGHLLGSAVSFHQRDFQDWPNYSDGERPLLGAQRLPISVHGAILPGRQQGLGLPVSGVLATRGAIIPRAIGRDIGCSVALTVFDYRVGKSVFDFAEVLRENTRFGAEGRFKEPIDDPIFDHPTWEMNSTLRQARELARRFFGSCGTGNHFADLGEFRNETENRSSLALMTHFGTRGAGQMIAEHYRALALEFQKIPKELQEWAYLPLDCEEGQEFWQAQELCRLCAQASHRWLHRRFARVLDCEPQMELVSCHNFATRDTFRDEPVIIHRKGCVELKSGQPNLICGSMADPTRLVEGSDNSHLLWSAAHGAGRMIGRDQARRRYRVRPTRERLKEARVKLLSGGQDEWPGVYREIDEVLEAHRGTVEVVGSFQPRLVLMNPHREPAED